MISYYLSMEIAPATSFLQYLSSQRKPLEKLQWAARMLMPFPWQVGSPGMRCHLLTLLWLHHEAGRNVPAKVPAGTGWPFLEPRPKWHCWSRTQTWVRAPRKSLLVAFILGCSIWDALRASSLLLECLLCCSSSSITLSSPKNQARDTSRAWFISPVLHTSTGWVVPQSCLLLFHAYKSQNSSLCCRCLHCWMKQTLCTVSRSAKAFRLEALNSWGAPADYSLPKHNSALCRTLSRVILTVWQGKYQTTWSYIWYSKCYEVLWFGMGWWQARSQVPPLICTPSHDSKPKWRHMVIIFISMPLLWQNNSTDLSATSSNSVRTKHSRHLQSSKPKTNC